MMPLRGKQCKKGIQFIYIRKNEFFLLENLITFWEKGLFRNKGYTLWKRDFFFFLNLKKKDFIDFSLQKRVLMR